jgi:RNA polymerase sigma-70 factor (ECF subfamily)
MMLFSFGGTLSATRARDTSPSVVDDAGLVEAAQEDFDAFAILYRRYVNRVYRYIYSRVGAKADAEDLTAQVFLEALEGLDGYREQGTFSAWLFTIAHRRLVDHYRRRRLATFPLDEDRDSRTTSSNPLAKIVQEERLQRLAALMPRLGEKQQEMLRLRFAAGLTYGEMATVLGSTEGAVTMAVHRLLRWLKAELEGSDG